MTRNHPTRRFAAVILNGAYRKYSSHQAGLAGLFYVCFMDDILVLAPTRWKLPS